MRLRPLVVVVSLLTSAGAAATNAGPYVSAGPSYALVLPADGTPPRNFVAVAPQVGACADGFLADVGPYTYLDAEMFMMAGAAAQLLFEVAGAADVTRAAQGLVFPQALDDPTLRFARGHLIKFRAGGGPQLLPMLGGGLGFLFDVGMEAASWVSS